MFDSEYAALAYARMRGDVRPGSKPMPHWKDLQETERELLVRMFVMGAEWACNYATADAKQINQ